MDLRDITARDISEASHALPAYKSLYTSVYGRNSRKLRGGRASTPSMMRASCWLWGRRLLLGCLQMPPRLFGLPVACNLGLIYLSQSSAILGYSGPGRQLGFAGGSYCAFIGIQADMAGAYYLHDTARALHVVTQRS